MLIVSNDTTQRLLKQAKANGSAQPQTPADWFHYAVLRGRNEVFCETVHLTPELAKILLETNDDNRRINPNTLATYVSDIKAGRWDLNGESIKVAKDGLLNDGQHRCWAVVESNTPIRTLVTFGVDRNSRMTLDQGKSRTVADYLSMEAGVKYAAFVTGAARVLWLRRMDHATDVGPRGGATRLAIRAEYWANQKELDSAAYFCMGKHSTKILGGPNTAIAALVLTRRESASADDFMSKFIKGNDLPDGDPILTLRTRLANTPKLPQPTKLSMILRAFDAWSEGRTMRSIPAKTRKTAKAGRK